MRQSRLRKFKNRKIGSLIIIQLLAIYLLGVYGLLEFTSSTDAAFNDIESLKLSLQAADEFERPNDDEDDEDENEEDNSWDKSSLEFVNNGEKLNCQSGMISAVVQNGVDSRPMKGPVTYEVYWTEKGNPKPEHGGIIVEAGQIPSLEAGETHELTYKFNQPGNYKFRALQRPGHPGKGELWSETIQVRPECLAKPKIQNNTENNKGTESDNVQTQEEEQTLNSSEIQTKETLKENVNHETSHIESTSKNRLEQSEETNTEGDDHDDENNIEMD